MSGKLNDSTDYGAFTYKKFTETFFKIEVISDCRYIVKDTDVETDKEIVHRYQTQEDAWNAAMLCANRQTFDLSVKMPGSVHMSVNYKEQTISVIGSDNQVKRLYKVTTAANQALCITVSRKSLQGDFLFVFWQNVHSISRT